MAEAPISIPVSSNITRSSAALSAELPLTAVSQCSDNPVLHIEHTPPRALDHNLTGRGNMPSTRSPAAGPGLATTAHLVSGNCRGH
eukprot:9475979-Pyramimonas_sp.AAC.1